MVTASKGLFVQSILVLISPNKKNLGLSGVSILTKWKVLTLRKQPTMEMHSTSCYNVSVISNEKNQ